MIKALNKAWGIFTHADIKNLDAENTAYCDMLVVTEETTDNAEEPQITEVETYREGNTSIPQDKWPFELTDEEIAELGPQPEPVIEEPVIEEPIV